jgi:hypothetical protein
MAIWNRLVPQTLSMEICSQKVLKAIHGSPIPCIHSTPDRLIWDLTANGMFTTRSAYQALQKDSHQNLLTPQLYSPEDKVSDARFIEEQLSKDPNTYSFHNIEGPIPKWWGGDRGASLT